MSDPAVIGCYPSPPPARPHETVGRTRRASEGTTMKAGLVAWQRWWGCLRWGHEWGELFVADTGVPIGKFCRRCDKEVIW